jgi:chromosomal replication initiator protein
MQTHWQNTLNELQGKIDPFTFTQLFSKLKIASLLNNEATILIPANSDIKEFTPYKVLIEVCWKEANQTPVQIIFKAKTLPAPNPLPDFIQEFIQSTELKEVFRFENFVPGDKAELAFNAAFSVAENPESNKYNPLFIYGDSGLGKTHLLHAIGNYIKENDASKRVLYITAYDFQQLYLKNLRDQRISEMSTYFRTEIDVLLIDDIQNWSGKDETQNEFFHIFNTLHQSGKQIVLTSDAPAGEVKSLSDRLVSRFSGGLTVDIQPPNQDTREAILRKKAEEAHIELEDEVFSYLAETIESNVRLLEAAITKLTIQSSVLNQDINLNLARKMVAEIIPTIRKRVNMDSILSVVSKHFEIPESKLLAPGRGTKEVAHARQVAMYLVKEFTTFSLKTIGIRFGGKDHSTVVYANKNIQKNIEDDPVFKRLIENLKSEILS